MVLVRGVALTRHAVLLSLQRFLSWLVHRVVSVHLEVGLLNRHPRYFWVWVLRFCIGYFYLLCGLSLCLSFGVLRGMSIVNFGGLVLEPALVNFEEHLVNLAFVSWPAATSDTWLASQICLRLYS